MPDDHIGQIVAAFLETGKGNISVARLAEVARALDISLTSLLPSENGAAAPKAMIALVGLRGAGKSTIGAALAKQLKVPFVELDALIEKEANLSLAELFSLHGESYYKRLANDLLLRLLAKDPAQRYQSCRELASALAEVKA